MLTPDEQTRAHWNPKLRAEIEAAEDEAERMERDDGTEPDGWWLWWALVTLGVAGVVGRAML